ncbi:hypothetical protein [Larkinella punicea]|uniref:Uncharacterized protein n=1 Tax=Larkinella punicea TaxID=2315727 RepID=A0A368JUC1_9BACT|nr:hypothetical protein [Larkinella punicea]RCR71269.1 hypothetical protein DUE52_03210 [Larkinella punicea]
MPICNTTLEYPGNLAEKLLKSSLLRFDEVREMGATFVKTYRTSSKFRNFSFFYYPKIGKVFVKGSWAKFHNNGEQNYSPYTTKALEHDIDELSELFDYDFSIGLIHGVEAGVNLNLSNFIQPYFAPKYFLDQMICFQGRKPFGLMASIRGEGYGVECSLTNYRIKAYDKGTQYHLPESLFRFEYDNNAAKELSPMGIRYMADLTDPTKLQLLGNRVVGLLEDVVMVEPVHIEKLSTAERKLYEKAQRPHFWRDLDYQKRFRKLRQFREITQTYSQYRIHRTLCNLARQQWDLLTENDKIL